MGFRRGDDHVDRNNDSRAKFSVLTSLLKIVDDGHDLFRSEARTGGAFIEISEARSPTAKFDPTWFCYAFRRLDYIPSQE